MDDIGEVTIDIRSLYDEQAKLDQLERYESAALEAAAGFQDVVLTGQGPIWLYLRIAHGLHGKARRLLYSSPVTGRVVIFDHNPF